MTDYLKVVEFLLKMNMKGYGSCNQIDKLVSKGELIPGKEYETGWVIQNGKNAGKGLAYRFINNDKGGITDWTENNNQALRFARREDAEQFAYHDEDAWRIVEYNGDDV